MSTAVVIASCVLTAVSLMAGIALFYNSKHAVVGTLLALVGACTAITTAAKISESDAAITDSSAIETLLTAIVFMLAVMTPTLAIGLVFGSVIYFMSRNNKQKRTSCD